MPGPFEPLRETLLCAGVAPAHVRRYVRELSEHVCDLVGEELKGGKPADEAQVAARVRLGADEALAGAMLAEPSLRSWTGRAPWATLLIGPILLLVLTWFVAILSLRPLPLTWKAPVGRTVLDLVQVAAPLLIASGVALLGARQRSRLIWPLLGCVAVAYFGGGLVWDAHWVAPGARGGYLAVGFRWGHSLIVGSLSLAIAAALYRKTLGRRLADA
jgi:hypothetical protein